MVLDKNIRAEKKYWILTTEFPPSHGGGISTYCGELIKIHHNLNELETTVFLPNPQTSKFTIRFIDNIRIIEFNPNFSNSSSFLGFETMIAKSFDDITETFASKEGYPEFLETQDYQGIAYFIFQKKLLLQGKWGNTTTIITCHCPSFLTFEYNHVNNFILPYFWIGEMERFTITAADIRISPSNYLVNELSKRVKFLPKDFNIIPNPIQPSEPRLLKREINKQKICFIGKPSPAKGILQILTQFDEMWKIEESITLTIIGDYSFFYHANNSTIKTFIYNKYENWIKKGLLTLKNKLAPDALKKELEEFDIILFPSLVENFPYTVLESMVNKKIVIASVYGGQTEMISHGENGFLFDPLDDTSFKNIINRIQSESQQRLITIQENAFQTIVDFFNPENYAQKKYNILKNWSPKKINRFPFPTEINSICLSTVQAGNLLSVVIPFFNLGNFLEETLDSLFKSTFKDLEVIIINDGSTDQYSLEILEKVENNFPSVKVIHTKNQGLSAARNLGAKISKGTYLTFLDADDLVDTTYYEKCIQILRQYDNVHFVGCWVQYFGNSSQVWPTFHPIPPLVLFHNMINTSSLVYKKSSFLEGGLNKPDFIYGMEDYESLISMISKKYLGVAIPEKLFFYRVRNYSMSRGFNRSNNLFSYQLIGEKNISLFKDFGCELSLLLNANGPGYKIDNPTLEFYSHNYSSWSNKAIRRLILLVKKNTLLRRFSILIRNKIKK